ncbi:unnamed protein product [Acanthosepion pharaonis]|uniref:Uncharacterized protein n=1 Tax=Acanthosepion pharaonis TaxID=158019 RepID=A0A812DEI8_ACAPH|nr:unnamed protein product [Sepia pharaonis]
MISCKGGGVHALVPPHLIPLARTTRGVLSYFRPELIPCWLTLWFYLFFLFICFSSLFSLLFSITFSNLFFSFISYSDIFNSAFPLLPLPLHFFLYNSLFLNSVFLFNFLHFASVFLSSSSASSSSLRFFSLYTFLFVQLPSFSLCFSLLLLLILPSLFSLHKCLFIQLPPFCLCFFFPLPSLIIPFLLCILDFLLSILNNFSSYFLSHPLMFHLFYQRFSLINNHSFDTSQQFPQHLPPFWIYGRQKNELKTTYYTVQLKGDY